MFPKPRSRVNTIRSSVPAVAAMRCRGVRATVRAVICRIGPS